MPRVPCLPPHRCFWLVAGSIITAPMGARRAHRLHVATLKRIFAVLMYLLATKMVVSYW